MQFINHVAMIAVLSTFLSNVTATPFPEAAAQPDTNVALSSASVNLYSGDTCNGALQSFSVQGSGSNRCVPVNSGKRSIQVTGGGCTVKTWSGSNCAGSQFTVPDNGCHSVLYASVSVQCN